MSLVNELGIGDVITCKGVTSVIAWVLESTVGSIKFIDSNGKVRRWSPEKDGGIAQKVGDESTKSVRDKVLSRGKKVQLYYDPYSGRFVVPFEEADYELSTCIMELISNGWALSSFADGSDRYYVVYSLRQDSDGWCPVNTLNETVGILRGILDKKDYEYASGVSLDYYDNNEDAQDMVDYVLLNGGLHQYKGLSINVVCSGGELKFVAVKNACY